MDIVILSAAKDLLLPCLWRSRANKAGLMRCAQDDDGTGLSYPKQSEARISPEEAWISSAEP
jgi:hypothetical protein